MEVINRELGKCYEELKVCGGDGEYEEVFEYLRGSF